ncbi:SDR family oxidoreductase [Streptomonospora nanhaiensis]|uniref:SDR family oxidoreductase n=1 Tax=Streptomonospora nanhaiensis TaxID=1323731 RepID=A0ABY6YGF9_9ACTN|nr:SDR family oxidoreductase [Streptomonospora nanhaiensis]WAE71320.1 SDR family oxidoreductase [Streptomonospora nanhaiensis]
MIDTRLAGQTVLVTGGSGNIGAAISRAFAAQGARVAVHHLDRDPPAPAGAGWAHVTPAAGTADELAEELGNGSFAVGADLSEPDGPVRLVREVADRAGPINVLVNNAAHCETPDTVDTLTHASLERHYRVNAVAPGPVQTGWMDEELVARAGEAVPMGRVGEPDDIADAVVYLASHQARWVTGQVLQVAGGHAL